MHSYEVGQVFWHPERKDFFQIINVEISKKGPLYRVKFKQSGNYGRYYEDRIENEMLYHSEGHLAEVLYA